MLKRVAAVSGAAAVAAPLIDTIVIPTALAHASTAGQGGNPPPAQTPDATGNVTFSAGGTLSLSVVWPKIISGKGFPESDSGSVPPGGTAGFNPNTVSFFSVTSGYTTDNGYISFENHGDYFEVVNKSTESMTLVGTNGGTVAPGGTTTFSGSAYTFTV